MCDALSETPLVNYPSLFSPFQLAGDCRATADGHAAGNAI
jgi:hypothetical protein